MEVIRRLLLQLLQGFATQFGEKRRHLADVLRLVGLAAVRYRG